MATTPLLSADFLNTAQRETLLAALAWWQEGERALDYLAERARQAEILQALRPLFETLRQTPTAATIAPLLPLLRGLAANSALNRGLLTDEFAAQLSTLLFGDTPLAERLTTFLDQARNVGAQTAAQLLFAAFPDRFALVTPTTRRVIAPTSRQWRAVRAAVPAGYEADSRTIRPEARLLLTEFVWYEHLREHLRVADFADLHAVLLHASEMPRPRKRGGAKAATAGVRETGDSYQPSEITETDLLTLIEAEISAAGFSFAPETIRSYYVALKTKPFVILAGLSGTGKTRLSLLLAEAISGAASESFLLLPVRPDWTDPTPLLGYYNLLADRSVSAPFLDLLRRAGRPENRDRAFFACLDEMNLARVEHYFADVLSAMETPERRILLGETGQARLPENVFLTGSINTDEATLPLGRKVLDRANVLEFGAVSLELPAARPSRHWVPQISLPERQRLFLTERVPNVHSARERLADLNPAFPDRVIKILSQVNTLLTPRGLHFGFRVRDEVLMFLANSFTGAGDGLFVPAADDNLRRALDRQILQKVLPRVSGTIEALAPLLREMENWATENGFTVTAEKIVHLQRRAQDDGLVTFFE